MGEAMKPTLTSVIADLPRRSEMQAGFDQIRKELAQLRRAISHPRVGDPGPKRFVAGRWRRVPRG
jgi:hypothetical protein